jgi:hypothetical protein
MLCEVPEGAVVEAEHPHVAEMRVAGEEGRHPAGT